MNDKVMEGEDDLSTSFGDAESLAELSENYESVGTPNPNKPGLDSIVPENSSVSLTAKKIYFNEQADKHSGLSCIKSIQDNGTEISDERNTNSNLEINTLNLKTENGELSKERNLNDYVKNNLTETHSSEYNCAGNDKNDTCYFSWLPREIILKIFSLFSLEEHLCRIRFVCKDWLVLSRDPILWKEVDFGPYSKINLLDFCRFLCDCHMIQDLSLRGRKNIDAEEMSVLMLLCKPLLTLDMGFCNGLDLQTLEAVVSSCPNLTIINLEGCNAVDSDFIKVLCCSKNLSSLNFSHCTKLCDESLDHLSESCRNLSSLNIDGIPWMSNEAVIRLIDRHHETLTSLVLDGDELTDTTIVAVSRCKMLKTLRISFCECLTDVSLQYVAEMKTLHDLQLRKGTSFSGTELIKMFQYGKLFHLRHLDLSECSAMTEEAVTNLVNCCGENLRSLALSWCWNIFEDGLEYIVKNCRNLEKLVLTGIDKIKGNILITIPEKIPRLKLLDLTQCNKIEDTVISELMKLKTDLTVFDYYGRKFEEIRDLNQLFSDDDINDIDDT